MPQKTIIRTTGPEMPPDSPEQAQHMKPAGFPLQMMPPNVSAADLAAALRHAEYLPGFVGFLPDEAMFLP